MTFIVWCMFKLIHELRMRLRNMIEFYFIIRKKVLKKIEFYFIMRKKVFKKIEFYLS